MKSTLEPGGLVVISLDIRPITARYPKLRHLLKGVAGFPRPIILIHFGYPAIRFREFHFIFLVSNPRFSAYVCFESSEFH